ncbi:hypothetical protein [Thalassobius sp. I31.1]|uniref:hypothetical protein n=1 Tax=Thalassobius sp. I31.1 TaxID=2109912 RepID=UPI000D19B004|nr:hypothetical protein [Thalassobius sp. I31.1]
MSNHPKKPFNLSADPEQDILRDKDNAAPRHEPKIERKPAPNLAPGGTLGIRHGLPSNDKGKEGNKRFALGATKEFKVAARKPPDKDRSRGR